MLLPRLRTLIGVSSALTLLLLVTALLPVAAEAQIIRRFAGGGVQVNAPFVRVNVGQGGTSVRAPFTSVNTPPGRRLFGRRRRALEQADYAAQQQAASRQSQQQSQQPSQQPSQQQGQQPTPAQQPQTQQPQLATAQADVDALPYPTAEQLAGMDDQALVETLRDMMSRLERRLTRLKTGDGWKRHLAMSAEVLGAPGTPAEMVQIAALQKMLPRYSGVADNPKFAKISSLPSFVATHSALGELLSRFAVTEPSPELGSPNGYVSPENPTAQPETSPSTDVLPTPKAVELPNATRGERSILKRK